MQTMRAHAQPAAVQNGTQAHPLTGLTQQPQAPYTAPPSDGDVVQLEHPIKSHQGDLRQIHLRPATFVDFIEIGDGDSWIASGVNSDTGETTGLRVETNYAAIMQWAVRLSGIDQHILGALKPRDSHRLMVAIKRIVGVFSKGN